MSEAERFPDDGRRWVLLRDSDDVDLLGGAVGRWNSHLLHCVALAGQTDWRDFMTLGQTCACGGNRRIVLVREVKDPYAGVRQDSAVTDWEQSQKRDNG